MVLQCSKHHQGTGTLLRVMNLQGKYFIFSLTWGGVASLLTPGWNIYPLRGKESDYPGDDRRIIPWPKAISNTAWGQRVFERHPRSRETNTHSQAGYLKTKEVATSPRFGEQSCSGVERNKKSVNIRKNNSTIVISDVVIRNQNNNDIMQKQFLQVYF